MQIERRVLTRDVEYRAADGEEPAKMVGYAAVFDSLSENLGGFRELIAPGAFDDVLGDDVRGLINHDDNLILGRTASGTMTISVDDIGLKYEIEPADTSYARDLLVSLQRGDVSQSSFGFNVAKQGDEWREDDEGRIIRTIRSVSRLWDVSPVTFPAYPDTAAAKRSLDGYQGECQRLMDARRREHQLLRVSAGI